MQSDNLKKEKALTDEALKDIFMQYSESILSLPSGNVINFSTYKFLQHIAKYGFNNADIPEFSLMPRSIIPCLALCLTEGASVVFTEKNKGVVSFPRNPQKAFNYANETFENPISQLVLAYLSYFGEVEVSQNFIEGIKPLAKRGNIVAQFLLAASYQYGKEVTKDVEDAAYWYKKAADQGNASAQFSLGEIFRHRRGEIKANIFLALEWYEKAASQGNEDALKRLGHFPSSENMYEITVDDLNHAVNFYEELSLGSHDEKSQRELKRIAEDIKNYINRIENFTDDNALQQEFENVSTLNREDLEKILDNINFFLEEHKPKSPASEKGYAVDPETLARIVPI